ncbi:MAG: amidase [Gammaproteobacteria bacterium]|nr:amidase [Gammaproteobacteria bacterium]
MKRLTILASVLSLFASACVTVEQRDFRERGVASLQDSMERGNVTSRQLVQFYLRRINEIDRNGPALRSIIEVNPDALDIAEALDEERRESGARGPLHGIPVVLKANIDTADKMMTTAGSIALAGHRPPDDAFIVARLREAGAVILGKANLSEWANFRSQNSSSGWSSIGGQTRNPYDPLRNPCGSSSGSAVAVSANLTVLAVGTETDGSVICPAAINGIVGLKPTLGLVSRAGIIPIAHSQDTAGPMGRTVKDAALLLTVMAAKDPAAPAARRRSDSVPDYAAGLSAGALRGKRIGVLRTHSGAGNDERIHKVFDDSVAILKSRGAEIVDPIEIDTEGMGDAEYEVLLYEFKSDLNDYLESSNAPLKTLEAIIEFNMANADSVMPHFGQDIMESAQSKGPLTDTEYLHALTTSGRIARDGINGALAEHDLDALIAPSNGPAWLTDHVNGDHFSVGSSSLAAVAGYPNVTVPAGYISGLPVGISFFGAAFSEKNLIEIAYAFEQANQARKPPLEE